MALEQNLAALQQSLSQLVAAVTVLGTTVEEDRPRHRDVVVATRLVDDVLAARGFIEEASSAALGVSRGNDSACDILATRRALVQCQVSFDRFCTVLATDLASYERLSDLVRAAAERGADWSSWTGLVLEEIQQCGCCVTGVRECLLGCWQELVDRAAAGSISIRNLSVGQHFAAPGSQGPG